MDDGDRALFERVLWIEAALGRFHDEPRLAVLDALGVDDTALREARARLDRALRESASRWDHELSDRCAWESLRAAAKFRHAGITLAELRAAPRPSDDAAGPLPDIARLVSTILLRQPGRLVR